MQVDISLSTPIQRTGRVRQLEGIFDVPPSERSELTWRMELPIEDRSWSIGAIVGPSGSGKSTVLRHVWHEPTLFGWREDRAIIDEFAAPVSVVSRALSDAGFSSPPSWLRPYGRLSTGEQFRVATTRALLEADSPVLIDEYTSVVDRTVAQIGSAAIAKYIRTINGKQLVVASCHYDVIDWLQPDWVLDMLTHTFQWRELQRRPSIQLTVSRCSSAWWGVFGHHHYLNASLHARAACYLGRVGLRPAIFVAVLPFPHPTHPGFRGHRIVCLPDFQGVGVGGAMSNFVAALYAWRGPYYYSTSHPGWITTCQHSAHWQQTARLHRRSQHTGRHHVIHDKRGTGMRNTPRATAAFKYIGPRAEEQTMQALGLAAWVEKARAGRSAR